MNHKAYATQKRIAWRFGIKWTGVRRVTRTDEARS